ncbi:cystathionine beta-lyase/cystathionine gamma-synthase [Paenibacillus sp. V4I3]|uniref:trans-sulfuration enzyme family protein n=1 Tax=Paenibacillus sp. V4I3 TaxID=3042305 RepID=UPI00277E4ED9|nr:PLP-dependent aspartate aminotransferase family protein [Paenibacillus sp. V4I3]MDQ0878338.1 cystathionine beta-lyase/cystathionine gamma-synthase [Paenibacillus sp. V4I3]
MNKDQSGDSLYTKAAHDPYDTRHHGAINIPVYQNSLFAFETHEQFDLAMQNVLGHHVYSRGNNPTVRNLEEKLAKMEGGEDAKCFASGMAAITAAVLSVVQQGDHIVCVNHAYGPTREFLGSYLVKFGIETSFVDGTELSNWEEAIKPNTKLMYLESPTTMTFELQDLRACAQLAASKGIKTIIDNTWATPCHLMPITLGIDLVVHSITKYISGHSDCLGGVVIGSMELMNRLSNSEYMLFGGIMTPQTASLVMRGLRTLPLRMERHQRSGMLIAEHISNQPYAAHVHHPGLPTHPQHELALQQLIGFSSLFSFESYEPLEKLKAWATKLQYFKIGVSWGGFESLVNVNVIRSGDKERHIVRLYVGLEDPQDLIRDIDDAAAAVLL